MDSRLRTVLLVAALGLLGYLFLFKKHEAPAPTAGSGTVEQAAPPSAAARGAAEEILYMRSGGLAMRVSTFSGASPDMYLVAPQFQDRQHRPMRFTTTNFGNEPYYSLRSNVVFERNGQNVMPAFLTFTPERVSEQEIELVARPEGTDVEVRRVIKPHTDYAFRVRTSVINHGAPGRLRFSQGTWHWVTRKQEGGGFFRQPWQVSEGLCGDQNDKLIREHRDELSKRTPSDDAFARNARFVGVGNLYMLSALVPQGAEPAACHLRAEDRYRDSEVTGSLFHAQLSWQPVELASGQAHDYAVIGYFGPKHSANLSAASPYLREAINLGFFAIIARGLLKLLQVLQSVVQNWGVAIILLTVIVRTALYPLLHRSTKSMAMMQKLKPELDAINEKFAGDANQRGLATMELYRKNGVNPVAGCLPQLAQLPVWWALYTTLQTSVELFHAPFVLWWRDLSAPDPYYVLPLVLGTVMFLQQKMMPPSMPDPAQAKMMLYFMPLFLTGISLFLPAGLALYMVVNSVLAIIQQRITKAHIDKLVGAPAGIQVRPVGPESLPGRDNPPSGGNRRSGRR
jgi:YidC/Oxa1 family membrane protein insertase